MSKLFLVQYPTYAMWQTTITADQMDDVILIKEVRDVLTKNEKHIIDIKQPNNPHAKFYMRENL